MTLFYDSGSSSGASPFRRDHVEIFATPVVCWVTKAIRPDGLGKVKQQGVTWRAELYLPMCQTTLLAGQPALAIGRRNNILIIAPCQCCVVA